MPRRVTISRSSCQSPKFCDAGTFFVASFVFAGSECLALAECLCLASLAWPWEGPEAAGTSDGPWVTFGIWEAEA
jgi:hypothetical protein